MAICRRLLLLFAALGLARPGRRGLKLVLLGWALLVFARIYGEPPLLGHIIGVLPGMSRIQFFRYGTAALELPVIVLAALGLDDLARVPAHRRRLLGAPWRRSASSSALRSTRGRSSTRSERLPARAAIFHVFVAVGGG